MHGETLKLKKKLNT